MAYSRSANSPSMKRKKKKVANVKSDKATVLGNATNDSIHPRGISNKHNRTVLGV